MEVSKQGLSCVEIEVLMFWTYSPPDTLRPLHMRSPAASKAELRFEQRGVLRRVPAPPPALASPRYALTPKGIAIVERIQSAALGIVKKIAPLPASARYIAAEDISAGDAVQWNRETMMVRRAVRDPYEGMAERILARAQAALKPKRGAFADVPRWIHRYERMKKTGTRIHESGLLTRAEWKTLFTEIFERTDKLRDYPCVNRIQRKFSYLCAAHIRALSAYRQVIREEPTTDIRNREEMA